MKKKFETRRSPTDHRTHKVRKTQIEFKMKCQYCDTEFWAKNRKAKFCSTNCRVLNHIDKQSLAAIKLLKQNLSDKAKAELEKEANFHKKRPQLKLPLKTTKNKKKK